MYSEINQYCQSRGVDLLVVSKMRSIEEVYSIYHQGQRQFAENRVQDLLSKKDQLPDDIQWHLIGTLQRNKVKWVAPFISLIHSIDDFKLWEEIHRQALMNKRIIPGLLQIKVAAEESKFGFSFDRLLQILEQDPWNLLSGVQIRGVMGLSSLTDDQNQIRNEFKTLKMYFERLKTQYFNYPEFSTLSMGMSGDYQIAIEEGSTLVRIGSKIFS